MNRFTSVLIAIAIAGAPRAASGAVFFQDDFESYADVAAVAAAGWTIFNTPAVVELEASWTLYDTARTAAALGLPATFHFGPANATGGSSPGNYMVSFADTLPGATMDSPTNNTVDSGASNDFITPGFSTVGSVGDVWLHANTSVQLEDGGGAIFDVEVSVDGGNTWDQRLHRVSPGRVLSKGATTFPPNNTNSGGYHGRLDLNLGPIGGQPNVRVRFRHYEQIDDEFAAIDDVLVDDNPPPTSGPVQVFSEDFNSRTLGQMGVYTYEHLFGFFGSDSGGGGASGFSWGTEDRASGGRPNGRYTPGVVENKGVNHLGHPAPKINGGVPFAIIDSAADEFDSPGAFQSERLHTPILDFTTLERVILEWDEEVIYDGNPAFGSVASVVVMQDNGNGVPDAADTIVNEPDKTSSSDSLFNPYVPYDQFGGGLFSGGDDPNFGHRYVDITDLVAGRDDVYIAFQYVSADTDYWAVDNLRITGFSALGETADFDGDGDIDGHDLLAWQRGFGKSAGATRADGDANASGGVNALDLDIWQSEFGTSAAGGAQAVPEPTAAAAGILAAWCAMGALRGRRDRRRSLAK
jgi:hypothetical protein